MVCGIDDTFDRSRRLRHCDLDDDGHRPFSRCEKARLEPHRSCAYHRGDRAGGDVPMGRSCGRHCLRVGRRVDWRDVSHRHPGDSNDRRCHHRAQHCPCARIGGLHGAMIMRTFIVILFCVQAVHAQSEPPVKTVLDGVYSDTQATRGKDFYTTVCSACHGNALEGVSAPALAGTRFIERWREGMLDSFYDFVRERMPFGRPANAKPIPDSQYLDIVTYILKVNGYPNGPSELTPNLLGSVMLVGRNGPQPVPDGALVVVVG